MSKRKTKEVTCFRAFMWKEMIVGNAISNGLINGVIYYLIVSKPATYMEYTLSTFISNITLALILVNLYPSIVKMKAKKSPRLAIPYTRDNHMIAAYYPKNKVLERIVTSILTIVLCTVISMGVTGCLGFMTIGVLPGAILRCFNCGLFSAIAYYFAAMFYFLENQMK